MAKKYSLFHVQGGFGKHIAATAVAKCIKNNHPSRELILTGDLNFREFDRVISGDQ